MNQNLEPISINWTIHIAWGVIGMVIGSMLTWLFYEIKNKYSNKKFNILGSTINTSKGGINSRPTTPPPPPPFGQGRKL